MTRGTRTVLKRSALRLLLVLLAGLSVVAAGESFAVEPPRQFRIWAVSCAHVPADIRRGRESLATAIRQSEGRVDNAPGFEWDVMLDAGDLSAHQTPPGDADGKELLRQYRALHKNRREQIYNVPGNHDAPYYDHDPGSWFRKWGDPLGENTRFSGIDAKRRPFPVEGTWERYRFVAGNVLFLMLADRNDVPEPVGRGHSKDGKSGGYPAGAVTRETFQWWKQQVLENQDKIIVTMHHHALRDTTIASGYGEGNPRYHGASGGPEGSSYLYYLIENDDPQNFKFTKDAHVFEDFLDAFHKQHGRGAIDLWIAGHTHVKGPEDIWGGKTITESRWGVHFLQVAALTRHHGGSHPMSRVLTLTDGVASLNADVYLHDDSYRKQPVGWYPSASKSLPLRHAFAAPPKIERLAPFPDAAEVFDTPYPGARHRDAAKDLLHKAGPSADLTDRWKEHGKGSLHVTALLEADTGDKIDSKPDLAPIEVMGGRTKAARFNGRQRVRVGPIDMDRWTDLTVGAWVRCDDHPTSMRVVSKDRIGQPGNFMLWRTGGGQWRMQAWDDREEKWRVASWASKPPTRETWRLVVGVVDSKARKVRLYVDGILRAESDWTADTLDDSDHADLVIGADSREEQFGHAFAGLIYDPQLYSEALDPLGVRTCFAEKPTTLVAADPPTDTVDSKDKVKGAPVDVITERDVAVPMRDGVVLRANVFKPDRGGPYPVLVLRTPYGKPARGMDRYVKAGYIVVTQDARGRYASDGDWESFLRAETHDAEDGYDTVEWAARLPNANGRVGTFGASYNAFLQWKLASLQPPSLVAMAAYSIPARYLDLEGPGTIRPGRRLHWWVTSMSPNMRARANRPGVNSKIEARAKWNAGDDKRWLWHLPWLELPQNACEDETEPVRFWLKNPHTDPWKLHEGVDKIKVPNLNLIGWSDHCNGNMLLDLTIRRNGATPEARDGSRTFVGPWAHSRRRKYGNIDFGPESQIDAVGLEIRWFDYWLKEKKNGVDEMTPWRIFVMGENRWRDETEWPLKRAKTRDLFLTSDGRANTPQGDGRLQWSMPGDERVDQFVYDPKDPVPSLHGPALQVCPTDQRPLANRKDILAYQTEPLKERFEVTGNPKVELFAATTAPDTDFFVRLIDVAPDGTARDVSLGMVRARYRHGLDRPELIEPGEMVHYTIEMGPTSNAFLPGHRIRLDITSSDFPNYDRNHNTAAMQNADSELREAIQTIHHGGAQASRIMLPWIPNRN